MSVTAKVFGFTAVAAFTQLAVSVVHEIVTEPKPPVEVTALYWDGSKVNFVRTVHSNETVRASVQNEIVDIETEDTVKGCFVAPPRRADFTPEEDQHKKFTIARFINPECEANLIAGRSYALVSVVIPVGGGEPSTLRSEPFVLPDIEP